MLWSFSAIAGTKTYDQCCFCITDDPKDHLGFSKTQKKDCDLWRKEQIQKGTCQVSELLYLGTGQSKKIPVSYECKKINFMTNFHGTPDFIGVPFVISKSFAEYFHAKEVCYDSHSCNVFDRTELISDYAKKLSAESPKIKYSISANQNPGGWSNTESHFKRWFSKEVREDPSTASRVHVKIEKGRVSIKYDPCSQTGERCIWMNPDVLLRSLNDTNNPNEKKCLDNSGKLTTQVCCPKRETKPWRNGVWLPPGEKCE